MLPTSFLPLVLTGYTPTLHIGGFHFTTSPSPSRLPALQFLKNHIAQRNDAFSFLFPFIRRI
jgi:hypothetical protein